MGKDRNSYSKTDMEATYMRMKEDHMLNGQLKPAYNVQTAVENYFIIHGYVSNDRTDYNTLIPVLEKHKKAFGGILEEVTADSGYCSGCDHKAKCLYKYNAKNAEKNRVMKINEQWEMLKEESHANIRSEKGIVKCRIRSIRTEGHFGDIKENENFRGFITDHQKKYIKNSCCMRLVET